MNINNFKVSPTETPDTTTHVEYKRFDSELMKKFQPGSKFYFKNRQDLIGKINRIEDGKIIIEIMGETYSFPPQDFENFFSLLPDNGPVHWYQKVRRMTGK